MHEKKTIFKYIYPSLLIIILCSLGGITLYFNSFFKSFYIDSLKNNLKEQTVFMQYIVKENLPNPQKQKNFHSICENIAKKTGTRITVIDLNGAIIADSYKASDLMENHSNRPEFIKALQGELAIIERFSSTQNKHNIYCAIPVYRDKKIIAVIRTSITIASIYSTLKEVYINILTIGLTIFILTMIIIFIIAKKITTPLEILKNRATRFAKGDFSEKALKSPISEIDILSDSMNKMAEAIQEKIDEITLEKNQSQLVFENMLEGIIAIDLNNHIITLNKAAKKILNIDIKTENKLFTEIVRNVDIQNFVKQIESVAINQKIELKDYKHIVLDLKGVSLNDSTEKRIGTLLVINDISHIVRLENIRKEFAATVSHELKTPLTAIKGAVETLLDGALDEKKSALHFTKTINRHSERLNMLINDILTISRIEQELETENIKKENANLAEIIDTAIDTCQYKATQKQINLIVDCNKSLHANVNKSMMEQVFINLIDNAITYSDEKGEIDISVYIDDKQVNCSVKDYGCGIASEHIPRLFERFYRVSKSRSRNKGGTGLGLSIVKHIIQAHSGTINIKSEYEKETEFYINIPKS